MSERHTARRTSAKTFAPLATAAVATAVLAGGAFAVYNGTSTDVTADATGAMTSASPTAAASASATPVAVPPRRDPQRVSRGSARLPAPNPTGTKKTTVTGTGTCGASFYDEPQGTANGERFNPEALTAAHKTLPFNTRVRVTNLANGKSVVVRINDRGPYIDGRCLDLSRAAFRAIANLSAGHTTVRYDILK